MSRMHMVGFQKSLARDLPVAIDRDRHVLDDMHVLHAVHRKQVRHRRETVEERRSGRIHVDEDEAGPTLAAHRFQTQIAAERACLEELTVGHAAVGAVQSIHPGMETADEARAAPEMVADKPSSAMLAGIVEGADLAVRSAYDNEGFATKVIFEPAADFAKVRLSAGAGPASRPDPVPF